MEVSTPEQINIEINRSPWATPNKSSSSSVKPFHNRIAAPAPTSTITYSFSGISGAGGFVGGSYPGPLQGLSQSFSFKVPALITNSESIPVANITTCIDGISALSGCKNVTLAPNAATVNGITYDQLIFSAKTNRNEDDRYYTFYYFFPANSFITQGTYTAIPLRFVLFSGGTGTLIISSSAAEVP